MTDQHESASVVVLVQIGLKRVAHVVERDLQLGRRLAVAVLKRGHGDLPVDRGIDTAVLRVARRLIKGDRSLLGIDRQVREHGLLVADRRIDVEAVDLRIAHHLRVRDAKPVQRRRVDGRRQARRARVRVLAGLAQPHDLRVGGLRGHRQRDHHRSDERRQSGRVLIIDYLLKLRTPTAGAAAPMARPTLAVRRANRAGPRRRGGPPAGRSAARRRPRFRLEP